LQLHLITHSPHIIIITNEELPSLVPFENSYQMNMNFINYYFMELLPINLFIYIPFSKDLINVINLTYKLFHCFLFY